MTDFSSSTNHPNLLKLLEGSLKLFLSAYLVYPAPAHEQNIFTGRYPLMDVVRSSRAQVSVRVAHRLNRGNPLMQLPIDVLHILLHQIDASSFIRLRQTSNVLRGFIDKTGLIAFNSSSDLPSCRRIECAKSFTTDVIPRQTSGLYDELQQRLPTVASVALQFTSGGASGSSAELHLERWTAICAALNRPASRLQGLALRNTGVNHGLRLTIPADILGGSAPFLRDVTLQRIGLPKDSLNEGFDVPLGFTGLTTLDYQPIRGFLTRTGLASLLNALPQLLTLSLRLISINTDDLRPIPHRLHALRVDGLRRGHNEVYHLIYKDSATLRRFEMRRGIAHWWQYVNQAIPLEHRYQLASGLGITELDIASPDSGPGLHKLRFYHPDGTGQQLLRDNVQWLTKVTLHHLQWPAREPLPEAPCLTELHVFITRCSPFFANGWPEPQDIFLAGKDTAWHVPALRTFMLSHAVVDPADHCTNKHHACCWRGKMLISAELLANTVLELLIFKRERLDEMRFSCIEFYECELAVMNELEALTRDIVHSSQPFDSPAAMNAPWQLPALKV